MASLALETALDSAIQGRQPASNGPDSEGAGGQQGGGDGGAVRNLAQELELIFKRDTGRQPFPLALSLSLLPGCLLYILHKRKYLHIAVPPSSIPPPYRIKYAKPPTQTTIYLSYCFICIWQV